MAGRPSKFSQDLADRICLRLSDGDSLRKICESEEMPSKTAVMRWLNSNPEFRDHYREAREMQADVWFDEQVDIADEATPETAIVAKLRIWARQWVMGRINAKKYGDKAAETNISTTVNNCVVLSAERIAKLQAARRAALEGRGTH
jgi:hypothetical protein